MDLSKICLYPLYFGNGSFKISELDPAALL